MPIDTKHPAYTAMQKRWQRMQDVCSGEDAIKAKSTLYLPKPNPHDLSAENELRYKEYLERAVFIEVTKDTLDKYAGQAFATDPILNVHKNLAYLRQNATGKGLTIYQVAQKCFIDLLRYGRCGVLVDYPDTTLLKNQDGEIPLNISENLHPNLAFYDAFSIINWRIVDNQLVMVILAENIEMVSDDGFGTNYVKQYRYLGLDELGYFSEIWQESKGGLVQVGQRIYPKFNHQALNTIPFIVMGSDSNDFGEQSIPLESLAKINLAHYRNSADYEDSVFRCGQVQPFLSGVSRERLQYLEDKDIKIGSATALMLEPNSSFGYAQASPNSLVYEAMQDKYAMMKQLGAKLVEATTNKTATQASQENSTQNSIASMCIANINEAFNLALQYIYHFANLDYKDGVLFKAKQEFYTPTPEPNMMTSLMALVQGGLAPKTVIYNYLRKHNLINSELSDDDLQGMIEADSPDDETNY